MPRARKAKPPVNDADLFGTESVESAFRMLQKQPPSDDEIRRAEWIAYHIFGKSKRDTAEHISRVNQGLAVLRIRNAMIQFTEQTFGLESTVAMLEWCATKILAENGAPEHPFNLPKDHHPLAQDALKLAGEIRALILHVEFHREQGSPLPLSMMILFGARLMRIVSMMEQRWFAKTLRRGQMMIHNGVVGTEKQWGADKVRENDRQRILEKWAELAKQKKHRGDGKTKLDAAVAAALHINQKKVQRTRLQKS